MAMLQKKYIAVPEAHYNNLDNEFPLKENTKDMLRDSIRNEGFGVEDGVELGTIFRLKKDGEPIGTITDRIVVRPFHPDGRPFNPDEQRFENIRRGRLPVIDYRNIYELVINVESVNYSDTLLEVLRGVLYGGRPMDGGRRKRICKTKKGCVRHKSQRKSQRKSKIRRGRAKKN
jgi:hypothetical protein